jgi:hypothetical protein
MKDRLEGQKPSHEEWLYWAQIVGDRLMTCIHIYSRPPYRENLISQLDRHTRNAIVIDFLHRLHALTDETVTPTDSLADVAHHDERVVDGLTVLLDEILKHLPRLSADMQTLLKTTWHTRSDSLVANEIFFGPNNALEKGLGSGRPQHGRLPAALNDLLHRERTDERRMPRSALIRTDLPRPQDRSQRRWSDQNSQFLRRAGTVQ